MARQRWMQRFAKWHIWLGWLVGVPVVMWTVSGLVMVAKPIEEVRGSHLRQDVEEAPLALDQIGPIKVESGLVKAATLSSSNGVPIWKLEYTDGGIVRYSATGGQLPPLSEADARAVVMQEIKGGNEIESAVLFDAAEVPFDFRRPLNVWQIALKDGTHIYVGRDTGNIEAVRTRWWRIFDFMWGIHIMDLQEREDTSHPILILFAALGVIGSLLGCILMFRRRKARIGGPVDAG